MIEKNKNIIIVISFFLIVFGCFLGIFMMEKKMISISERRKLASKPEMSVDSILSGDFMDEAEEYLLDHFPGRDNFRSFKAEIAFHLLQKKDNEGIYLVKDGIYKLEYPLKEDQVLLGAKKLNELYDTYLTGMNVYYGVIPDKNYYVAKEQGYLSLDYERMLSLLRDNIRHMTEIKLFDCLEAEDYYRTDLHWKQTNLTGVLERLSERMNLSLSPLSTYDQKTLAPFYGSYYGQAALNLAPEEIIYLSNDTIEEACVYNLEKDSFMDVYTPSLESLDAYELFLSGATAFLTIDNKNNTNGRELIIFRDSFASSLAPLLLEEYAKITLIDLRYMSSQLLPQLITFEDQDVLFLYSTLVFNQSAMLR